MGGLKGDFISFSFNGVHSSELGITRTSDGSRYNENLLPTIQDKTVQVPGADGTYFFGSFYTQRQFSVPIAFDSLTEAEYRKLRQHFGDKGIHELIFDERPYKVYMAKSTGTPQLKTICFDGEDKDGSPCRIYKGEGTLTFTAYYPFARSRFKYLEHYTSENIPEWKITENKQDEEKPLTNSELYLPEVSDIGNLEEWRNESGIEKQGEHDIIGSSTINLYNPGDLETDLKVYFDFSFSYEQTSDSSAQSDKNYYIQEGEEYIQTDNTSFVEGVVYYEKIYAIKLNTVSIGGNGILTFKEDIIRKNNDYAICINSKTNLIEGVDSNYNPTGTLYNEYMDEGTFFKVPLGSSTFKSIGANAIKIEYDYIYY